MKIWVVGKTLDYETSQWQFQGCFDSEERAVAACRDIRFFVGPSELNEELPVESCDWDGAYYPLAKDGQCLTTMTMPIFANSQEQVAERLPKIGDKWPGGNMRSLHYEVEDQGDGMWQVHATLEMKDSEESS